MPRDRPVSRKSGLQLAVDTRWANNYGYRPVHVTVTSPQPTTANRLITIRLHISGWGWYTGELSVEQDFELPLGQSSVTTTVPCPQYRLDTQCYWWDVWVDGVKDRDLSLEEDVARSTMVGAITPGAQAGLSCLVVGPSGSQRALMTPSSMQFDVLSIAIADMPRRWIEYTCFDVVALRLSELQFLARSAPEACQALRRWVGSGGQLWISDVGEKFDELAQLSNLLQLRPSALEISPDDVGAGISVEDATEDSPARGWRPVRFRAESAEGQVVNFQNVMTGRTVVARDPQVITRLQRDPNYVATGQRFESAGERRRRRGPGESSRWFLEQPLGFGAVHVLRGPNDIALFARGQEISTGDGAAADASPAPQGEDPMGGAADAAGPDGDRMPTGLALGLRSARRWEARHGMTPDNANRDFANLLVPGVGLAPVTEFRVLITLFVLLIGPGNYWFLKRIRRSHLLVLTVPAAALLTTAALFAYAVLSDGFGTTVRVHSFTMLDQRTGEAACWARLSVYSGLAPGHGLTMPSDAAVYPIIPGWNEGRVDPNLGVERDLVWESSEAKLTRGWLRSRTPTQYLVLRARKSPHALELQTGNGKARAANKLGSGILLVVVVDDAGNMFVGENLGIGAKVNLQPIKRIDAIRRFRQLVLANQPQIPSALSSSNSDLPVFERRPARVYRQFGFQYSDDSLRENLASKALETLAGLTNEPALNLPARSYLAVTETGPEVVIGMSAAEEEASFHVIVGQW
jgi:hypothetical protein